RMTLTHYILSLTLGMIVLALLSGKTYTGAITDQSPLSPTVILIYSAFYFGAAVLFSALWSTRFKNGPFELLMRKI
ncbi:MAG: DUF418 domain-containing protein, partial [Cytophagales bacterium]|nr:DUF418 domain-containing protein [Cytophagales bacterium]